MSFVDCLLGNLHGTILKPLKPQRFRKDDACRYSVVEPGRLAFISGQVAWQPNGAPVPESLVEQAKLEQAKLVTVNASAALHAAGASPEDLVLVRVCMVDLTPERLNELMPTLLEFFDGSRPSVTGVGIVALAAPDLQLEVEMIARLPS